MIRMRMRQQNCINTRKLGYAHPGWRNTREEIAELIVEIWIGEHACASERQQ